jgi:hypothetical protein
VERKVASALESAGESIMAAGHRAKASFESAKKAIVEASGAKKPTAKKRAAKKPAAKKAAARRKTTL